MVLHRRGAAVKMILPIMHFPFCGRIAARHLPSALRADQQAGKQVDTPGLVVADGALLQKLLHTVEFLRRDQRITVCRVVLVQALIEWIGQHPAVPSSHRTRPN